MAIVWAGSYVTLSASRSISLRNLRLLRCCAGRGAETMLSSQGGAARVEEFADQPVDELLDLLALFVRHLRAASQQPRQFHFARFMRVPVHLLDQRIELGLIEPLAEAAHL